MPDVIDEYVSDLRKEIELLKRFKEFIKFYKCKTLNDVISVIDGRIDGLENLIK